MGLTFYKCRTCGATVSFDLPKYNKGLANTDAAWNTRAKPPVGECGTCSKYMAHECPMCSFDIDGACTGGPETGFYCALYGMEAHDGKTLVKNLSPGARFEWQGMMWIVISHDERGTVMLGDEELPLEEIRKLRREADDGREV